MLGIHLGNQEKCGQQKGGYGMAGHWAQRADG
jgi:hypothetical protein